ncbi:DHH family phosphoesterase [Candidatus Micrarchaeota archaeon]|nr:DHH family phosphoesterase [Candidatus Micrarchaeota archaeon]
MDRLRKNREIFEKFIAAFRGKKLVIATHRKADADGIASAYALSTLFPGSVIAVPDELDEGAKKLAEKIGIGVKTLGRLKKTSFDGMAVVDTSAYTMIKDAAEWKLVLIIDHHEAEGSDMKAEYMIIEPDSPSTAEMVAGLIGAGKTDGKTAFALSVGIIADTARFRSSSAGTFETLAGLMGICKTPYVELLDYAEPELSSSAKIAVMKALQRVQFIWHADYVIATTETGSNESDAASLIADIADAAFVASWKNKERETRISARASKKLPVGLNEVMKEVGLAFGGKGGGHKKAAGASAKEHPEAVLKKCVDVLITKLEEKKR